MRFVDFLPATIVCLDDAVTNWTYIGTCQWGNDHSPQDNAHQQECGWWPDAARS